MEQLFEKHREFLKYSRQKQFKRISQIKALQTKGEGEFVPFKNERDDMGRLLDQPRKQKHFRHTTKVRRIMEEKKERAKKLSHQDENLVQFCMHTKYKSLDNQLFKYVKESKLKPFNNKSIFTRGTFTQQKKFNSITKDTQSEGN